MADLGEEARRVDRTNCSLHGVPPAECFYLHHQVSEVVKRVMLVMPCHHLIDRPEMTRAVVVCDCGKKWTVQLVEGGQAWNCWAVK